MQLQVNPIPLEPLSLEDRRHCYHLSQQFQQRVDRGEVGCTWKYQGDRDKRESHIRRRFIGNVGGLMLSRVLGMPWHEGNPETWNNRHDYGDVGWLDLRTRAAHWHELTVRPNDRRILVLIRPITGSWCVDGDNFHEPPLLLLVGWQECEYIREYGSPLSGQSKVKSIPDDHLLDVRELM